MDELSTDHVQRVHMNHIPIVWDLLNLNILLYDKDIVDGNFAGEFARQSVQKYENTVRLLRNNYHICYVNNINAVFQIFAALILTHFHQNIQFGSTSEYMQWTREKCPSEKHILNPRNSV